MMSPFTLLQALALLCLPAAPPLAPPSPRMQIVAHEDDDLLFMNPSAQHAIAVGRPLVSVYLTAGDAGEPGPYWQARETGIRNAYAAMAHAPESAWETSRLHAGEASFKLYTLGNPAQVTLLFLRLPDGGEGVGSPRYHAESLRRLWHGELSQLDPVDGQPPVTRAGLIEDLLALLRLFAPDDIALSDCTALHGWDHNDHFYSAMFGLTAFHRYAAESTTREGASVTLHRGYNIEAMPPNLDGPDLAAKRAALAAYMPHDTVLCPPHRPCIVNGLYEKWLAREYPLPGTYAISDTTCFGGP